MPVNDGDVVQISAVGQCLGQRIMMVLHYSVDVNVPNLPDAQVVDSMLLRVRGGVGGGDVLESKYLACLAENYTLDAWWGQKLAPTRYRKRVSIRAVPGTLSGDALTANICAVITKQTELSGRRFIGSAHVGPPPTEVTYVDNGLITTALAIPLGTFANALLDPLQDLTLGYTAYPCLYHPDLTPPFDTTAIEDTTSQDTVRVMRRRTVRVGE